MKAKAISSEKRGRASSGRTKKPMTDEQVISLMQPQLERNRKTLDALAKL